MVLFGLILVNDRKWKHECLVSKLRFFLFKPNISQIGTTLSLPLLTLLLFYYLLYVLLHAQEFFFIYVLQLSLLVERHLAFVLLLLVCFSVIIIGEFHHHLLSIVRGDESPMLIGIARACLADERLLLVSHP